MRDVPKYMASTVALVVSNLVPFFGVLFLSWDTFEIIGLYWVENVLIGAINILKIVTCRPNPAELDGKKTGKQAAVRRFRKSARAARRQHHTSKSFFVPFFTLHYGIFCLVHGMFVLAFFAPESFVGGPLGGLHMFLLMLSDRHLAWGVLALAASHAYSFLVNYLGRGEYRRTVVTTLMLQPYARVVVLHLALLFGAMGVVALGSNTIILVILVIGKTVIDLALHLAERRRNEGGAKTESSGKILAEVPID